MNEDREAMRQRIREAVAKGNRAGSNPPLPERGAIGYQGAGDDLIARFREEFTVAGGQLHLVADRAAAMRVVVELVRERSSRRVLLGRSEVLDALHLTEPLCALGVEIVDSEQREDRFAAEVGLSGVDYLIAETGSVVLASRPEQPRSLSLLPPVHVAVAERRQLLPDLFDLFAALGERLELLPACVAVITGPSKTGDIELRLVTGVHGPGEIHVVLIDPRPEGYVK
jgi:L-lactate dehydrogenase complex protein LldG